MLVTTMSELYHTGVSLQNELVLASYQGRICDHRCSRQEITNLSTRPQAAVENAFLRCAVPSEPVLVASGANSLRLGAKRSL